MAGQWWTVITITATALMHLSSRLNPSQHSRRGSHCQLIKVVRENLFAILEGDEDSQLLLDLQSITYSEGCVKRALHTEPDKSLCRSSPATVK